MDAAGESIRHLKKVLEISEHLARDSISLYRHDYHLLASGSFSAEFGKPHCRVLCHWDGKESILSVSFAKLQNQGGVAAWTHDANISVSAEQVYAEIASSVEGMVRSKRESDAP